MNKFISIFWMGVGALILSFIGVKEHPEHQNNRMVIVKHRPNFKLVFYSPILSSDNANELDDLNEMEKKEELYYREFIKREDAKTVDNFGILFFQLGIYLLVVNVLQLVFFRRKNKIRTRMFFSINTVGLLFALLIYQIYWTEQIDLWIVIALQTLLNTLLIFPGLRKNQ